MGHSFRTNAIRWLRRAGGLVVAGATLAAGIGIANATTLIGTPGYSYQQADPNGNISLVGVEAWDGSNPTYCIGTGMNVGHVTGDWKDATNPNELIAVQMVKDHLNASHDDLTQAAVSYAIKDHLDTRPDQWNAIKDTPASGRGHQCGPHPRRPVLEERRRTHAKQRLHQAQYRSFTRIRDR